MLFFLGFPFRSGLRRCRFGNSIFSQNYRASHLFPSPQLFPPFFRQMGRGVTCPLVRRFEFSRYLLAHLLFFGKSYTPCFMQLRPLFFLSFSPLNGVDRVMEQGQRPGPSLFFSFVGRYFKNPIQEYQRHLFSFFPFFPSAWLGQNEPPPVSLFSSLIKGKRLQLSRAFSFLLHPVVRMNMRV